MNLNDLPTFTILSVNNHDALGDWTDPKWIGDHHVACLITDAGHFSWGRWHDIDQSSRQSRFAPDNPAELAKLQVGRSYPLLDGYWGERAELVLNVALVWREREYAAQDAVWCERSRTLRPYSGEVPEGGTLIKGGWDHEHCEICWETISQQTAPAAVFAEPNHWICKSCFQQFVVPRSLGFIVDPPAQP